MSNTGSTRTSWLPRPSYTSPLRSTYVNVSVFVLCSEDLKWKDRSGKCQIERPRPKKPFNLKTNPRALVQTQSPDCVVANSQTEYSGVHTLSGCRSEGFFAQSSKR